jgi:hypothetical protein
MLTLSIKNMRHFGIDHSSIFSFPFYEKFTNIFVIFNNSTRNLKSNTITNRSLDPVATTTSTRTSLRSIAYIAPRSLEAGKIYCTRACCIRQIESRHAKILQDQRKRAATIADEKKSRS